LCIAVEGTPRASLFWGSQELSFSVIEAFKNLLGAVLWLNSKRSGCTKGETSSTGEWKRDAIVCGWNRDELGMIKREVGLSRYDFCVSLYVYNEDDGRLYKIPYSTTFFYEVILLLPLLLRGRPVF
jgi:hypothetical protein